MNETNYIQNARFALHLTQQQLAEKLGCSQDAVSAWERGYRNPSKLVKMTIKRMLNEETEEKND